MGLETALGVLCFGGHFGGQKMGAEMNWKLLEERIGTAVKLARRPVAVAFLDAEPVERGAI